MLTNDVNEVIIEGKTGYDIAKKYTKSILPQQIKNIKLFKKSDKTLFNENNIEHQINELFSLKVNLASGGSIVINNTEALVAIDVNSGKNTTERNIENTALKTNLEAAVEVARQLRLRDLGGLVVIDFIDMDDYRNNFKVEKTIKNALYRDRAKVLVGRISMFGLLELSRQRLRTSLIERSFEKCHYCNGSGIILNTNSISDQILKVVNEKLINSENNDIEVKCNTALADILLNTKRDEIQVLENRYQSKIKFILDDHFSLHEPEISLRDKKNILSSQVNEKQKPIKKKRSSIKKELKVKSEKKSAVKKNIIVKKSEGIKYNKKKIPNKIKNSSKILTDKQDNIKDNVNKKIEKSQKSGWWSE